MQIFRCRLFEMQIEARLLNVVQLGVGFLFLFTAFQSCGNIQVNRFTESRPNCFSSSLNLIVGLLYMQVYLV